MEVVMHSLILRITSVYTMKLDEEEPISVEVQRRYSSYQRLDVEGYASLRRRPAGMILSTALPSA